MSTRQNKKQRKGRNNANNRERTVTTLTEDPNTHYLIPTPSEEPAGSHLATQFPGAGPVGGKAHNMSMGPQPYQIPGNFGFGYPTSFVPIQHTAMQQHQQPQPYYPSSPSSQPSAKPALPPGKNDLEILQNLKKIIKDGQHPFYRAVPSPAALASLYKGTIPTEAQSTTPIPSSFPSSNETNGKQLLVQEKDSRPASANRARSQELNNVSQSQFKNTSASSVAHLKLGDLKISRESSGPPSEDLQPEVRPSDATMWAGGADVSDSQHPGKFGYDAHSRVEWNVSGDFRPASPPASGDVANLDTDDSSLAEERPLRGTTPRRSLKPRDEISEHADPRYTPNPYTDVPLPLFRDFGTDDRDLQRALTPNPYLVSEAVLFQGTEHGVVPPHDTYDRESDYSMKREWHPNNYERRVIYDRPRDAPSGELHRPSVEADIGHPAPALRAATEIPVPLEAHNPDIRPSAAIEPSPHISGIPPSREPESVPHHIDDFKRHDTILDTHAPPAPVEPSAPDMEDIQSSRGSSALPADTSAPASVPPIIPGENLIPSDASSMPLPSLKERINQPTPTQPKARNEVAPAAPEHPPVPPAPPHHERFHKKNKFQKGHHFNGPGKYGRQGAPPEGAHAAPGGNGPRTFRPRSPSLDARKAREYRGPPPGRAVSRDRGNYRPDFHDPRRVDGVDPDVPPARYDGRPYSEFPPPSANERRPSAYTGSPPPMSGVRGPTGLEGPPGRGDYYSPYPPPPTRGDWEIDEDPYKSRSWDRPPPGVEREHFERELYPPRPPWDIRQEREFIPRDGYPPLGGPPSDDRYQPGPPLSRDADRSGRPPPMSYNPPYGRVRGRSPSPLGRPGAPPVADSRPPMKRAREDFPDYYPSGRAPPRGPSDYPPPRSGGGNWPPAPESPGAVLGGGPPPPPGSGRDYRMREPPLEYVPAGYERPRSPPPPGPPRPSYTRGSYVRPDRGGYGGRPPQ